MKDHYDSILHVQVILGLDQLYLTEKNQFILFKVQSPVNVFLGFGIFQHSINAGLFINSLKQFI